MEMLVFLSTEGVVSAEGALAGDAAMVIVLEWLLEMVRPVPKEAFERHSRGRQNVRRMNQLGYVYEYTVGV